MKALVPAAEYDVGAKVVAWDLKLQRQRGQQLVHLTLRNRIELRNPCAYELGIERDHT